MNEKNWNLGRQDFGRPEDAGRLPAREEALTLLNDWVGNERLKLHMRQVSSLLRVWALEKRGHDESESLLWELAGLLHDADWDRWPDTHCRKIIEWLEERHYDPTLIHAIASHGPKHFGVKPRTELDFLIWAFDELSGFVHAVSLMRPTGYEGLEPSSIKKKLKDKSFAAQVDRDDIAEALKASNLDLDEACRFVVRVQKNVS